jgi:hypothetical protein
MNVVLNKRVAGEANVESLCSLSLLLIFCFVLISQQHAAGEVNNAKLQTLILSYVFQLQSYLHKCWSEASIQPTYATRLHYCSCERLQC